MAEYKRFVSYIYAYEQGVKNKNVGFAKVEERNGQCKFSISMKGAYTGNEKEQEVYLFYRKQDILQGVFLGSFRIDNGIGEFNDTASSGNIKDSGLSLSDMGGIILYSKDDKAPSFASAWDDHPIKLENFSSTMQDDRKSHVYEQLIPAREMHHNFSEDNMVMSAAELDANSSFSQMQTPEDVQESDTENSFTIQEQDHTYQTINISNSSEDRENITAQEQSVEMEDAIDVQEPNISNSSNSNMEHVKADEVSAATISDTPNQAASASSFDINAFLGILNAIKESQNQGDNNLLNHLKLLNEFKAMDTQKILNDIKNLNGFMSNSNNNMQQGNNNVQMNESVQKNQANVNSQSRSTYPTNENNLQKEFKWREEHEEPMLQAAEIPCRDNLWDHLYHQFPKVRAFEDDKEIPCLKIDLKDLDKLPRDNWILGNNSFLLHGYYNFRYLLLAKLNEDEIILGVPGMFHQKERVMATMFGFEFFKPTKPCKQMSGQFGYWYRKIKV